MWLSQALCHVRANAKQVMLQLMLRVTWSVQQYGEAFLAVSKRVKKLGWNEKQLTECGLLCTVIRI